LLVFLDVTRFYNRTNLHRYMQVETCNMLSEDGETPELTQCIAREGRIDDGTYEGAGAPVKP